MLNLSDIIPINFFGGCGGMFLCNWLTSAKLNATTEYTVSRYGSMHQGVRDLEIGTHRHDVLAPLTDKLEYIKNLEFVAPGPKAPPYFTTIHHNGNASELLEHFEKVIHIHYSREDIREIGLIFLCKNYLESNNIDDAVTIAEELLLRGNRHYYTLLKVYSEVESDHICNVSWSDMYHNDPEILLNKVSMFTNIPKENFTISNLLLWRQATREGLLKVFSSELLDKYNITL